MDNPAREKTRTDTIFHATTVSKTKNEIDYDGYSNSTIAAEDFESILECMGEAVVVKDNRRKFVFANKAACKMFDVPANQWLSRTEYDILPKGLSEIISRDEREIFETGLQHVCEGEFVDACGNVRMILATKSLCIKKGDLKYLICIIRDITTRKTEILEEAQKNEQRYQLLADNITDVIYEYGLDGKYKYVTPSVREVRGFSPEELIGHSAHDFMTVESRKTMDAMIMEELEKEKTGAEPNRTRMIELELMRKDGSTIWAEIKASFLRDPAGRPTGVLGVARDITKRRRTEEALRARELQLSHAMQLANIVYWELDLSEDLFVFNDPFYAFFGTTAEREGGYRMSRQEYTRRFVHPDDRPGVLKTVEQNTRKLPSEPISDIEHRIIRRNGEVRNVVVRATTIMDDSGRVIKRYGVNQDITERKRAAEELISANQRLLDIIEFLPDATFVIDGEKRVLAWNRACEELTGVKKDDIIGKGDYAYAIPFYGERKPILIDFVTTDSQELYKRYSAVRRKGNVLHAEAFVQRLNNGKGAYLSGTIAPLFDSFGKTVGAIEISRDITDFKKMETQLVQAQKMEAIGTLAGGIAHDFNNILTALTGYATLLQMGMKHGPLCGYVDNILLASKKAADLVQNLLAFSRQQNIRLNPVSLKDIVNGTEKLLKRLLTEDIAIQTLFTVEDVTIMADPVQIDQILFNLASNARDAMPRGGTFTIETSLITVDEEFRRTHGFGEPGCYARLSVSDTGVGIEESVQKKIFDPFFTTKEAGKGTGLGLSTVYGIVKQHNGYITVSSKTGDGTTFRIYLPVIKDVPKEDVSEEMCIKAGRETILIGEDNDGVRELLNNILTNYGYTVIQAVDGQDTIEQFKKADIIDLVILDSIMPRKNGREAYDEIASMKPDVKVIFTSGHTRDTILDKGIEEGKFSFLAKPILPVTLLKKVREVLDA